MTAGDATQPNPNLIQLRLQWRWMTAAGLVMLAAGFFSIWITWSLESALRWLILPVMTTAYLLRVLRRNLAANHRLGEQTLLPALGWGNLLTVLRGFFVAGMTGFLLLPRPPGWLIWFPGVLYILSDLADFFDGYLARRTNRVTRLGEILDLSFDGLGVLTASVLAVQYGQVPLWYLAVAFARPLFLAGLWLRQKLGLSVHDLYPSLARRLFAGLQMGFLAVVLLPLFTPPGTHIAAALFSLPFLVGFALDWLYVSGALRILRLPRGLTYNLVSWLPLGLRLGLLALNLALISLWLEGSRSFGLPFLVITILNGVLVAALALGILPRITTIFALCILGFYQMFWPLNAAQIILAGIYTALLYLGGGSLSLWNPEEVLFQRPLGEASLPTEQGA